MMATLTKEEEARKAARQVYEVNWTAFINAQKNHDPTAMNRIHDQAYDAALKVNPNVERRHLSSMLGGLKSLQTRGLFKPTTPEHPQSTTLIESEREKQKTQDQLTPPPVKPQTASTPVKPQGQSSEQPEKLPAFTSTPEDNYVRVTMPDGRVYDVPSKGLGSTQEAYDAAAEAMKHVKQESQAKGRLITLPDGKKVRVIEESGAKEDEVKYSPEALAHALSLFANATPADEKTKMVQQLNVRSTRGPDGFQERVVTDTSFDAFVEKIPISDLKRAMFAVFKSKYGYEGTIADFVNDCIEWFFKQRGMELEFVERTPNISDRRNMEIR